MTLRAWGSDYYHSIGLPIGSRYVVSCEYTKWTIRSHKKIDIFCEMFGQTFDWDATAVRLYGMIFELSDDMLLVDAELIAEYPGIMA